ncbi:MAG: hypothetical protein JSW16_00175 [Dehalococcoidales bacterium]|nr:MAG: hypothetical protein JSW16_00175 [Dehalococcoidales bacterium]
MLQAVTLSVGQTHHLKFGKDRITYAGMVSEDAYSMVQRKDTGYRGYAWNLFFQKRQQNIIIDGVNINIENVTPEEIRLRVG